MSAKDSLVRLCNAVTTSDVSPQMKAWWSALRAKATGGSLGSIFD